MLRAFVSAMRINAQLRVTFVLKSITLMFAALLFNACADETPVDSPDGDAENDTFLDGKADRLVDACSALKVVNTTQTRELDLEAGLDRRAAANIELFIKGPDGVLGSDDDRWFRTLDELDAIKWVGPKAFERIAKYGNLKGITCGDLSVQVLAFNDFHGALRPPSGSSGRIQTGPDAAVDRVDAGGVEFMHTRMRALAATNPNTVIVAAGDVIGATPLLSALFHDEPTVESMNLLGLEIASVGNHEFDEGLDELTRMQHGGCHPVDGCQDGDDFEGANYKYLAANVLDTNSGETVLPPYEIRRFGNAAVAFVGMTLEGTPLVTTSAGVDGLTFRDEAETVNALVPELAAKGVHAIVVLLHEGGAQSGLYNECVGISGPLVNVVTAFDDAVDVVVAGHTNAAHVCDIGGKLVTSAASNGRLISDIELVIDERTGEIVRKSAENVIVERTVAADPSQGALISRYEVLAAPMANRVTSTVGQPITKLANEAGESLMGDLIADAQLATGVVLGAEIAFMNPGGIRTDLLPEQISGGEQVGEVTYGELFAVQPFGNNLIVMTVTGAQIEAVLEQQWRLSNGAEVAVVLQVSEGFAYSYDPSRPLGDRVDPGSMTFNGQPIDLALTYRVVMNAFLAEGGDGFSVFKQGVDRAPSAVDVDALETHLSANSPYAGSALDRITRL